jgi:outer membrane biosynthesis protein TonB
VKRVSMWFLATTVALVLLFSYHTSTSGPAGAHDVAGIAPAGVVAESPATRTVTPAPAPASVAPSTAPSAAAVAPTPSGATATTGPRVVAPAPSAPPPKPSPTPSPSPSPKNTAATTRTINGAAADTRYGPVQVQIKVSGNRIVSSDAIVYPTNERRDREINDYAVPQLNDETVQAQSANIDTVSGATYTSDGYRQSLQSAIDAAHLS